MQHDLRILIRGFEAKNTKIPQSLTNPLLSHTFDLYIPYCKLFLLYLSLHVASDGITVLYVLKSTTVA